MRDGSSRHPPTRRECSRVCSCQHRHSWNDAVEKQFNHGWTRMDTDGGGLNGNESTTPVSVFGVVGRVVSSALVFIRVHPCPSVVKPIRTAWIQLRAFLKSLCSECGRPRPQQCTTSNRSPFPQHLSHYHVAAPEDGRTPSKFVFTPKCIFRQAMKTSGRSFYSVEVNSPRAERVGELAVLY